MSTPVTPPAKGYGCCCQVPGLFYGMPVDQLQQMLADAQAALIALMLGQKGVSFSYTQGDGARSVTNTPASMAGLNAYIRQLQQALGIVCHARRPARFLFR
jgi:gpW